MHKIHQLSLPLIAKIAAGEVIERPAYAVKELIENAIDAHADYITIQIEAAGLKKIVVTDNGIGMEKDDVALCFKPHTTSKISNEEDLLAISSLGFRGEALASLAAISTMTIKSKTSDAIAGTIVRIQNSNIIDLLPVGMPSGTIIRIDNLFGIVPARKKFLKTIRTEFRHITDIVMDYAIAYPAIRFFLTHDKRIILDVVQNQTIEDRIAVLLGHQVFNQLIPISYSEENIRICGFISRPQLTSHTTQKQYLFVNKRSVTDRLISSVIKVAYGNRLEASSYPICILFLEIPYELVDINVHPRKEQILFVNSGLVAEHITKALSQALSNSHTMYSVQFEIKDLILGDSSFSPRYGNTDSFAGKLLKEVMIPWQLKTQIIESSTIIQLHATYLILSTKSGLLVVDQHAAHERILYEQYQKEFRSQHEQKSTFTYQKPVQLEVSFSDAELIQEYLPLFTNLGFTIEHFRDTTFLLRTIPFIFQDRNCSLMIIEILDTLRQGKNMLDIDRQSERMIAYLACRSAVKKGDILSMEEAKNLIEQLERTENNATCPHGRPTKVEVQLGELHKIFKRK